MKGIRDFVNKLSDAGSYQYSYNPEDRTYTQLSGPGTPDDSLDKRIIAKMVNFAQKGSIDMKKGGKVKMSSASKRADGCATKGKTRGRMV
jgi:hypothetical protein